MRSATILALLLASLELTAPAAGRAQESDPTWTISSRAAPIEATRLVPLEHPWAIERLPDGGFLITEKPDHF